jgi:transposase
MSKPVYIGLDIGKHSLSCSAPDMKVRDYANTTAGISTMLNDLSRLAKPAELFFVMEATGGYSYFTACTLLKLSETRAAIVPPACVLGFIHSKIKRTKNDRADALAIRHFAEVCQPPPWLPPAEPQQRLRDLYLVLDGVIKTIARKKCQLEKLQVSPQPYRCALDSLLRSLACEQQERLNLEAAIEDLVSSDPAMAADSANMLSIKGVSTGVRNTLMALCYQQLKTLPQRKLLASCGLSPQENQSGKRQGQARMNRRGDRRIRRVLYMAALGTTRKGGIMHDYFQRQKDRGKPGKSAMVSVMRKLLYLIQAVVKSGTPFDSERYLKAA